VGVAAAARVAFGRDQHMLAERGQMMTTQRTSIRRRLAIRRTAHRPPWGWRQVGHSSIVAPIAATLAATLAVGVGVALARVERERRAGTKRRKRARRFGLNADEQLGAGLRRIALGQIDVAVEALRGAGGGSPEQRVHEARKALKRLRALLRLLEDELGERTYARESAVVRDAGRRVARARDAEVVLNTLDALIERHPKELGRRRGVRRLRVRLQRERDGAAELALADGERSGGDGLAELLALRIRVATWQLASDDGVDAVEPALARIYGKGRKRMRRAARASGTRAQGRKLHEWRKRVKDLRYVAEMLERADADERDRDGRKKRKRARAQAAFIGNVARRADDLGELLGEEHDLAMLAERVRAEANAGRATGAPGRGSRKALLRAIAHRRKRLRKRALRDGKRLYERNPKRFVRRMRRATTPPARV
jgi:CHAD domain-containing protein